MPGLLILDQIFSSVIVTPLVVSFWVPVWELMARKPDWFSPVWILYVNAALLTAVALAREACVDHIRDTALGKWLTWTFVYACSNSGIMFWRALWGLEDQFLQEDLTVYSLVVALAILLVVNAQKTLIFVPFLVEPDGKPGDMYMFPTLFNAPSSGCTWTYTMDCIVSVCGVGTLIVSVWRSVWYLLDLYVYPENPTKSAIFSTSLGYATVVLVFALHPFMLYIARRSKGVFRQAVVDVYQIVSFVGSLNIWRGIWMTINIYILPERPDLRYFLLHSLSFLLLTLINSTKSLMARGVYVDGEEDRETCVNLQSRYITIIFQKSKKKQEVSKKKEIEELLEEAPCLEGLKTVKTAQENLTENSTMTQESAA